MTVNETTYYPEVDADHFITGATLSDDLSEVTLTLGDYWVAPGTEAEPTFSTFRVSTPEEIGEPTPEPTQVSGPQDPIIVGEPVVPTPDAPAPAPQLDTVETTTTPTDSSVLVTLPATGADELSPITVLIGAVLVFVGIGIVTLNNRRSKQ